MRPCLALLLLLATLSACGWTDDNWRRFGAGMASGATTGTTCVSGVRGIAHCQ